MMVGSVLTLVLAAGTADSLTPWRKDSVKLQVPAAWKQTEEEGTQRFTAPSGDAYFLLDVGKVQRAGGLPAQACVDKIKAAIGGEGWEKRTVGGAPAARKVDVDDAPEAKGQVKTLTYVGCDGRTTWSLIFHLDMKNQERFEPLAEKIGTSLAYQGSGGPVAEPARAEEPAAKAEEPAKAKPAKKQKKKE